MSKKIYDIVPPGIVHKHDGIAKEAMVGGKRTRRGGGKRKTSDSRRYFPMRKALVGGAVVFVLFSIYMYKTLQRAYVKISPVTETISFQEKITADVSSIAFDSENNIIPARYIEVEKEDSMEFPASGVATEKGYASGTITVYNKAVPIQPLTLIKGTHFLSDSGKYFVAVQKVAIPVARYEGGKLIPSSVNAEVVAKEPGSDYNIGSSKFSIPKLAGTAYYYSTYGESKNPMRGGHLGQVKQITDEDIKNAQDVVVSDLLEQAEQALENFISEEDVVLDKAVLKEVATTDSQTSGTIADSFNHGAKVKISALAFKKKDLDSLVENKILSRLPDGKTFLKSSLGVNYTLEEIDVEAGKMTIKAEFSAKTHRAIDVAYLAGLFAKKPKNDIAQALDEMYPNDIFRSEVDFWPFWTSRAPGNANKIDVRLIFE